MGFIRRRYTHSGLSTMSSWEIKKRFGLLFPCPTCGAEPDQFCHVKDDPYQTAAHMHAKRTEPLDRLWKIGYAAGRDSVKKPMKRLEPVRKTG